VGAIGEECCNGADRVTSGSNYGKRNGRDEMRELGGIEIMGRVILRARLLALSNALDRSNADPDCGDRQRFS
jgi:hypothetical protein